MRLQVRILKCTLPYSPCHSNTRRWICPGSLTLKKYLPHPLAPPPKPDRLVAQIQHQTTRPFPHQQVPTGFCHLQESSAGAHVCYCSTLNCFSLFFFF